MGGGYSSVISREDQYFERDIVHFTDEEIIVDAGAFVGDTLLSFVERLNGWNEIICLEPDKINFEKLKCVSAKYDNVRSINAAVGAAEGEIGFSSFGSDKSKVDPDGEQVVPILTIDSLNRAVTYLKMDIEGFEVQALKGAEHTIRRHRPKLALSIYHKADDLWRIPLLINEWVPTYKFYVRHYSPMVSETVLYAIPDSK